MNFLVTNPNMHRGAERQLDSWQHAVESVRLEQQLLKWCFLSPK